MAKPSLGLGGWSLATTGRRGAFAGDLSLTIVLLWRDELECCFLDIPNTKGSGLSQS